MSTLVNPNCAVESTVCMDSCGLRGYRRPSDDFSLVGLSRSGVVVDTNPRRIAVLAETN